MTQTEPFTDASQSAPVVSRRHALFLDFDGTLASLQDDPDTVALPHFGADRLRAIADALGGALVLISGRDVRDLSKRVPDDLWRAGGHGLEVCPPGQAPEAQHLAVADALLSDVNQIVSEYVGARVEVKGKVLAIHYRQCPASGPALFERLRDRVADDPSMCIQHGKMVIELKPVGTDKGTALTALMQSAPFAGRVPIMVGDDTTDEDAMTAAIALGGFGIKVGAGETHAGYRFDDTEAVWNWLEGVENDLS